MSTLEAARRALHQLSDSVQARTQRGFFKNCTDDTFLGVPTASSRRIAKEFAKLSLADIRKLMQSSVHDERSLAHQILRLQFEKADEAAQKKIFDFYLRNRRFIHDWDGVDDSAPYIVGPWLLMRDKVILYELAQSPRLWDRRIAIVSTWWFIRKGHLDDTFALAELLLHDPEDLIQKATGWMLRETGKNDIRALEVSCVAFTRRCRGPPFATPSNVSRRKSGRATCDGEPLLPESRAVISCFAIDCFPQELIRHQQLAHQTSQPRIFRF